ncbi:MAG: hypothetical protein EP318_15480 [Rhodobacteraceae bacterium]|nr:MAG: hypothetical protein EP318_15480 [Paracoccaceae bacterium]
MRDIFQDIWDRAERRETWQAEEARRIAEVRARGVVPGDCGPVSEAPARGAFTVTDTQAMYPDGQDGWVQKPAGYRGRKTLAQMDPLDVLEALARKRMFSPTQKAMARHYRSLTQDYATKGVRCSSLERSGGGGDGTGYIEAVLRQSRELDLLHARIGRGVVLPVKREGSNRRPITARELVDGICIYGRTPTDVLKANGWAAKGAQRAHVVAALREALDRMTGPLRGRTAHFCAFG